MASSLRVRIASLREALAQIEPYPWSNIEAWRARALPLFREDLPQHVSDFEQMTTPPNWLDLPRFSSGGNRRTGQGPRDNFAEAAARELSGNTQRASEKKKQILGWLDGILDHIPEAREESAPQKLGIDQGNAVFVVHGRDDAMKETVARFLERLGLQVVILHEKPDKGRTVIEKFEQHSHVGFAVVLLTADDRGGLAATPDKLQPRARQNVVLELGYFLGILGRSRVCALKEESVEVPSDLAGLLYVPLDSAGAWKLRLASEIKASGIDVDLNRAATSATVA
jgi:predicted nucleotide-binding protein